MPRWTMAERLWATKWPSPLMLKWCSIQLNRETDLSRKTRPRRAGECVSPVGIASSNGHVAKDHVNAKNRAKRCSPERNNPQPVEPAGVLADKRFSGRTQEPVRGGALGALEQQRAALGLYRRYQGGCPEFCQDGEHSRGVQSKLGETRTGSGSIRGAQKLAEGRKTQSARSARRRQRNRATHFRGQLAGNFCAADGGLRYRESTADVCDSRRLGASSCASTGLPR